MKKGIYRNCKICNKEFYLQKSRIKDKKRGKFCSKECYYKDPRKSLKGKHLSPNTEFKKGQKSISYWKGKKNPALSERNRLMYKGPGNPAWKGGIRSMPGYKTHYNRLRKERMKNVEGSHSFTEWLDLKKFYKFTCLSCKRKEPKIKLTEDHIIPIVKGGTNYITNIQPLCASCNSKKKDKLFENELKTSSLIVGAGEIGNSLFNILKEHYQTFIIGKTAKCQFPIVYLHICFPYDENFINEVKKYQDEYKPIFTIIHSTVPLGVNRLLKSTASPCRGLHPHLESGLKTFPKFLGGEEASSVADYFRRAGLKVILYEKPETAEALKMFDTEYYRHCIEFAQEVQRYCDEHNLSFSEVYTIPNETYNKGYTELGHSEYVRPVLQPIMHEISGHCVLPNLKLLGVKL